MANEITLDLNNEFVAEVACSLTDDSAVSRAIALLEASETRHGVELVVPGLQYDVVDGAIRVVGGRGYDHLVDAPEEQFDDLLYDRLFPFLSETQAVLGPSFPDGCDSVIEDRHFLHGTARATASWYAEWASRESWLGKSDWEYIDLYYGQGLPSPIFAWVVLLRNIVFQKCERGRSNGKSAEQI